MLRPRRVVDTRLPPKGDVPAFTYTGISFREEPHPPSLQKIIEMCRYYERKCGGKTTPHTPAARALYDLSRDVQAAAQALQHRRREQRSVGFRAQTLLDEWEELFGDFRPRAPERFGPAELGARIEALESRVEKLQHTNKAEARKRANDARRMSDALDRHAKASRQHMHREVARMKAACARAAEEREAAWIGRLRAVEEAHAVELDRLAHA